jgi:hypothetical protein
MKADRNSVTPGEHSTIFWVTSATGLARSVIGARIIEDEE